MKVQVIGNVAQDVELSYGRTSGKAYARLRVAENSRVKRNGEWADGPTKFHTVIVYGAQAENAAESITKGQRVVVIGDQRAREYTKDGATEATQADEIHAEIIAPTLEYGTTTFTKTQRASKTDGAEVDEADIAE